VDTADDLTRMAALLGLRISRDDLARWAPLLRSLFADLERLLELPLEGREPAFMPGSTPAGSPGKV
jgi:hypothetical protein